jgi:acetate kinase
VKLLAVNTGSSSVKAAVFDVGEDASRELSVRADGLGSGESTLRVTSARGTVQEVERVGRLHQTRAMERVLKAIAEHHPLETLDGVGHRVVYGGRTYSTPQRVTPETMKSLADLLPLDPEHLPQALAAIEAVEHACPGIEQVVCFDTAFHRHMPGVAQIYPLPSPYREQLIRYGFHGLSYEYVMSQLAVLDPAAARGRVVVAHLGNGASMAAILNGRSVDTTMGLTPLGGLMMGTRTGDLDPGVMLQLGATLGHEALTDLVTRQSGLLGVSGISSDVRELLARQDSDAAAAEALALFVYTARKYLGALIAVLGGLDALVFTGGIGEHASAIREGICRDFAYAGLTIDQHRNTRGEPVISREGAAVTVRVIETDEEVVIARHTASVIRNGGSADVSI